MMFLEDDDESPRNSPQTAREEAGRDRFGGQSNYSGYSGYSYSGAGDDGVSNGDYGDDNRSAVSADGAYGGTANGNDSRNSHGNDHGNGHGAGAALGSGAGAALGSGATTAKSASFTDPNTAHKEVKAHLGQLLQIPPKGKKERKQRKVKRESLMHHLRLEQRYRSDCLAFPLIMLYFVFFSCTVMMHEDIANVSQVERNIRSMIEGTPYEGLTPEFPVAGHKVMEDVDGVEDVWTYLYDAILPLFLPDLQSTDANDVNRVLRYNQLIGGMQLQQIRRRHAPCIEEHPNLGPKAKGTDTNPLLVDFTCYPWNEYTDDCFGDLNATEGFCADNYVPPDMEAAQNRLRRLTEDTLGEDTTSASVLGATAEALYGATARSQDLGRRLFSAHHAAKVKGASLAAVSGQALGTGTFVGGLYTVMLHEHEGRALGLEKIMSLQDKNWLDDATAWMGVKMFILNPDLAVFTHVIINFYFPPSGALVPELMLNSFPAEPYQDQATLAVDAIFLLLWVHLFIGCCIGVLRAVILKKLKAYWKGFWTWISWASMVGGLVILGNWLLFIIMLGGVKEGAMNVVLRRPLADDNYQFVSDFMKKQYLEDCGRLHSEVASLSVFLMTYRLLICWYTILIMVRFFQAFEAQPRLAIVTETISKSLTDIAHFVVLLILVFCSYAIAGMLLFGHRMLEFSEFHIAMNQCFLIMLGSFDYYELANENPTTAALWFCSYMMLVSLIMLNMCLAIVMDMYTEVKGDAVDAMEIWTQAREVFRDFMSHRDWIRTGMILMCVDSKLGEEEYITKQMLLESVSDMPNEQAEDLLKKTEKWEVKENTKSLSISDAMKMVSWIKIAVQKVSSRIDDVIALEKEEKELLARSGLFDDPAGGIGGKQEYVTLDPGADQKLYSVERKLAGMEGFLNENMASTVSRGKEMRSRLTLIEDLLKAQADGRGAEGAIWDSPMPTSTRGPPRDASMDSGRFGFNTPVPNRQANTPARTSFTG